MTQSPGPSRPKPKAVKLEIPANLAAQYVNFALITYSLSEMILDFAQVLPNTPKSRVSTRVLMTPTNAKLLHKALGESIAKYEDVHGEIKVPPTLADQLFSSLRVGEVEANGPDDEAGDG